MTRPAKTRKAKVRRFVREWIDAIPTILGIAGGLWVAAALVALLRGFDTRDPLEVARRLAMAAGFSILAVVGLMLAFQLIVAVVALFQRKAPAEHLENEPPPG